MLEDFIPVAQDAAFTQNVNFPGELKRFVKKIVYDAGLGSTSLRFPYRHLGRQDASIGNGKTIQGVYAFDAAGRALGGTNSNNPQEILSLLREAKRLFDQAPPKSVNVSGRMIEAKPPLPARMIVANVYSRIKPLPSGVSRRNRFVGRDRIWITPSEIEEFARGGFAPTLAARLARYTLVDHIRGQADFWPPDSVKRLEYGAKAVKDGDQTRVEVWARFRMERPARRPEHTSGNPSLPDTGFEGSLQGEVILDAREELVDLKFYVDGTHWGRSAHNPDPPPGKFPLKFAIVLADDRLATEVPPAAVAPWRKDYLWPKLAMGVGQTVGRNMGQN